MGHGIAQVGAMAGYEVVLYDVDDTALEKAVARIRANLDKGVKLGKVETSVRERALAGLTTTTDLETAAAGSGLIIEAAPEKLDLKQEIFAELDRLAPGDAVLATNTSSLSVTRLAAATERPTQVLGMHFFNPVHIMKLLEIVRTGYTSKSAIASARTVGEAMGKTCIVVKDAPGFASSRLGLILGMEAIRMLEEGVASVEDIDTAMELGYGHPMGPFRLADLIGLDVRLHIAEYMYNETGEERWRPSDLLKRMVADGKLGKKTGEGFYRWDND
ncbi:MAG: 3-hydroxyacyl-CoA dehydrogenase family protein [Gemmatimonadetes bacterium]|uniref:3-hydroxyacyl-CoA dehydrogenase family protein n=1 Tax=Candidatus Kutchimonas denitrificans TaxID=3056748 RepID=A0AAE4Z875_9BACT|nr:3-hydroxyacyl-CoA dehydrogenase family protein [Gemmatimonadota bacterium]NIR74272.1 3-hydroxyacyl-CoA dehydrogenase family protein [Candidatus Kutchimonas denitrificans]NIS02527.1 3-hydroxyacyl-CoA dehydrogenase family protein [Gemmatimonadota bacterium]NIT68403.1 3-hydroxyacyl-CoA dehydrogenase family protein [Gemmatimonadota bacterium]NIU51855.1 3-hydroxybutyryl-CoA dehydrogenase [Gemmatimonadota bacterium]